MRRICNWLQRKHCTSMMILRAKEYLNFRIWAKCGGRILMQMDLHYENRILWLFSRRNLCRCKGILYLDMVCSERMILLFWKFLSTILQMKSISYSMARTGPEHVPAEKTKLFYICLYRDSVVIVLSCKQQGMPSYTRFMCGKSNIILCFLLGLGFPPSGGEIYRKES